MRRHTPILLAVSFLGAHAAPNVRGTVQTADGGKVLGASVWLFGVGTTGDSTIAATTHADGTFRFSLPLGASSELVIRRRGFRDARVALGADAAGKRTVDVPAVTLAPVAAPLLTAVVPDTGAYTGPAAAFFRRLASRRVTEVITRGDLQRIRPTRLSTALRTLPGVALESGGGGATYVRLRGRRCYAALWLDGAVLGSGRSFDVDAVPPSSLLGIEVFSFPTGLPIEYQSAEGTACGVVALWTTRDDGPSDDVLEPSSVAEPSSVRLTTEVDTPARVADSAAFAPRFPSADRAEGIGGTVVVELVVDTTGAVERGSLGVVSSPAFDLADATLRAAQKLRFVPARAGGRAVRQLVQLAADFRATVRDRR
jgi:TonB family protein